MTSLGRRRFLGHLGNMGLLGLAALGPSRAAQPLAPRIPAGIQLYTVRNALQSDASRTLRQLRSIGYRSVETAGFGKATAREFRRLLDDAGLNCPSAHLNFLQGEQDSIFEDAHVLGAHYVVSSILRTGTGALPPGRPAPSTWAAHLRDMTLEDAKQTAELANHWGLRARKAGLQYAYHNHFFEFADLGPGFTAYDVLLRETDPDLVMFEIDCGWMRVAGHDPIAYLRNYPHRFPMIHVKDFRAVAGERTARVTPSQRVGTELGHGFIDYRPIFAAASAAGLKHYFAEQEGPFQNDDELAAAKISYDYLQSIGA